MTTIKPALDLAARAAIAARTEALFRASGAFREGHFLLKSGRHGDAYVEKFAVLSDPAATSELCGFWAAAPCRREPAVDLVAGPTTGGVILAFETARQLGTRSIFAEEVRDADGRTRREFRRGFTIEPGERVLLVDDILTTGGSLLAMIPAVEALGGEIVECAVMVDRSGGRATLTSPTTGRDLSAAGAVAAGPADLRAGPGDLSALRRRRPALRARAAPGPPRRPTGRLTPWIAAPGRLFVVALVVLVVGRGGAAILLRRRRRRGRRPPPGTTRGRRASSSPSTARASATSARSRCGPRDGDGSDVRPGRARERRPSSRRATSPSTRRPREPVRVWYRDEGGTLPGDPARGRRAELPRLLDGRDRRPPAPRR